MPLLKQQEKSGLHYITYFTNKGLLLSDLKL